MANFWKTFGYAILSVGMAYVVHRWPWAAPGIAGGGVFVAGHLPGWNQNNGGQGS